MRFSKYTRLGLLVVFSLFILFWGLSYLKGNDIFKRERVFHVIYNRVDGLVPANKVTINGYQIGQVQNIEFADDNSGRLHVVFSVHEDVNIPKGSIAKIISSDLMGTKEIAIILNKQNEYYLSNDTIPGAVEQDLKEQVSMQVLPLKNKAEELIGTLDSALTALTVIFNEDARHNLSTSFSNINQTIKNIEAITADLQEVVASEKNSIKNIVANVDTITSTFGNNTSKFEQVLHNLQAFTDTLSHLSISPLINNLAEASQEMNKILTKLNSDESTAGLILNDPQLYHSLNLLSENLAFLAEDVQQNPKRYLNISAFDFGKEVYVNTNHKTDKDIRFKILLLKSHSKVEPASNLFKGLNVEEYYSGKEYSYLTGESKSIEEINNLREALLKDFPGAKIIAFKKGKIIPLERAVRQAR